ncbi:MAG: SPFH domain-containing protein [Desulfarculaceae bacterium]|jgi:regulator of protease activity HflC (stomatin/prohibitin superfamily)
MGSFLSSGVIIIAVLAVLTIIILIKTAVVVPQKTESVVERLGKYNRTLAAGFHILIPFLDRIAYKRSLKEEVMDIPSQVCITRDNVSVEIDGVIYLQVQDAKMSAYGIDNYKIGASQLAQTSLRSAIGKIDLDKTFEERETINQQVVEAVDEAAQNWGVKVLRYEIKDITPPSSVMSSMEAQMKAEREKRAEIARSEGERQAKINRAEGLKQEAISVSEGEKTKRINEAAGRAKEIELVATATAEGLRQVAESINGPGGFDAANLRIAEKYLAEFGKLASENNTMIIPGNLSDLSAMVAAATSVFKKTGPAQA